MEPFGISLKQQDAKPGGKEYLLLTGGVLLSFIIHAIYIIKGFGEVDSCGMALLVLRWQNTGVIFSEGYVLRTSIFYLQFLKQLLSFGMEAKYLPDVMNWLNVVCGSLIIIPAYWLFRRIAGIRVAVISLVCLSFVSSFWISNLFGTPHIPGILFFCISLMCFQLCLEKKGWMKYFFWIAALVTSICSLGFKADILLYFGAYSGLILLHNGFDVKKMTVNFSLPLFSVLFILTYPNYLNRHLESVLEFSGAWGKKYPFTISALYNVKNVASTVSSFGIVLFFVVIILWLYGIVRRKGSGVMLFCLSWSLPAILFWCLKMGNSARHMTGVVIPVVFYASFVACDTFKKTKKILLLLAVCLGLNYFISPVRLLPRTYRPSSKIFHAQSHIQHQVSQWHQNGKEFSEIDSTRKIIVGNWRMNYAVWETLKAEDHISFDREAGAWKFRRDGSDHYLKQIVVWNTDEFDVSGLDRKFSDWGVWRWKSYDDNTRNKIVRLR